MRPKDQGFVPAKLTWRIEHEMSENVSPPHKMYSTTLCHIRVTVLLGQDYLLRAGRWFRRQTNIVIRRLRSAYVFAVFLLSLLKTQRKQRSKQESSKGARSQL